jgi:hypothetical protein
MHRPHRGTSNPGYYFAPQFTPQIPMQVPQPMYPNQNENPNRSRSASYAWVKVKEAEEENQRLKSELQQIKKEKSDAESAAKEAAAKKDLDEKFAQMQLHFSNVISTLTSVNNKEPKITSTITQKVDEALKKPTSDEVEQYKLQKKSTKQAKEEPSESEDIQSPVKTKKKTKKKVKEESSDSEESPPTSPAKKKKTQRKKTPIVVDSDDEDLVKTTAPKQRKKISREVTRLRVQNKAHMTNEQKLRTEIAKLIDQQNEESFQDNFNDFCDAHNLGVDPEASVEEAITALIVFAKKNIKNFKLTST